MNGFTTAVINLPYWKLANRIVVHCFENELRNLHLTFDYIQYIQSKVR